MALSVKSYFSLIVPVTASSLRVWTLAPRASKSLFSLFRHRVPTMVPAVAAPTSPTRVA
jgi:hypothetical protein